MLVGLNRNIKPLLITIEHSKYGRSQNTVPIASTQVAIKGIIQHSMRDS